MTLSDVSPANSEIQTQLKHLSQSQAWYRPTFSNTVRLVAQVILSAP